MTVHASRVTAAPPVPDLADRLTIVLLTHNCANWIDRTVHGLRALDVPVLVVDNASTDDTVTRVRGHGLRVVQLATNRGAAARNVGAELAGTPYIAFCDDDGWFERAGLERAVRLLDRHASLALLNARILVNDEERLDPISREMECSPLDGDAELPGTVLMGFMAGAVVVRREAFLEVGGYDHRFFIGGEEETVAIPLLRNGWRMRYDPQIVVHHYPSGANAPNIRHFGVRNTLTNAWLHRPFRSALSWTWFITRTTPSRMTLVRGLAMFVRDLPWIVRDRTVMAAELDDALALLDERRRMATPGRRRHRESVW
ncbi:MAG TPA: glycosyltransferase [Flexivirga sp.]|uniref:glycosyltransferase family 2 protein n=1 Tax=Flexivirga sp. TaxID=1962927 RepID=UPI002C848809|nr:glycosyltransferase [Flexivirga sp.]HWC21754.1 glycosyltransferase [Flexivirga sp.]